MSEEQQPYKVEPSLHREIVAARTLRENLADILRDDEDFAADVIEGQTNIIEAIELAVKQIGEDEVSVEALASYIEKMKHRSDRYKRRLELMRTAVTVAMEQAGRKKIETPYGTVSRRTVPRAAIVQDEADIPSEYWKRQEPKLDKSMLTADLRAGKTVKGATLSNGSETITIRRA